MIPPASSLVRHDNPVLVSRKTEKKHQTGNKGTSPTQLLQDRASPPFPSPPKKLDPIETKVSQQTEEILHSILPPREWDEEGQLWIQHVSSTPATRLDVINLQEQLDMKLQQRQARETGICPVRRELYSQCFDELIRQVIFAQLYTLLVW
ncbi:PREDICTED: 33 kDa inner dynein arm light chain, axonemal-like [Priapulus caudatus]|uniref:33 kDa inner dynein arm light chain, axonemal-like n=1 Tax=Priapulus caudatus TaxID=37621 RepID=A0ABM1E2I9_PRICU|nr:PREDICTED: 33 kDa inner dynein arm light chain, axonemal-like [Priapulus caudatus]